MNPASELREITSQLKRLIVSNMEMGIDFSRLSVIFRKEPGGGTGSERYP